MCPDKFYSREYLFRFVVFSTIENESFQINIGFICISKFLFIMSKMCVSNVCHMNGKYFQYGRKFNFKLNGDIILFLKVSNIAFKDCY